VVASQKLILQQRCKIRKPVGMPFGGIIEPPGSGFSPKLFLLQVSCLVVHAVVQCISLFRLFRLSLCHAPADNDGPWNPWTHKERERSISPQAHAGIHGDTRSRPCSTHTRARRSRTQHHSRTARARRPADDTWTQGQHSGHLPHGGASLTRSAQIPALSLEVGTSRRASRGRPGSPGSCGRGAAGRAWQGGRRLVPKSPAGPAQRSICCCL